MQTRSTVIERIAFFLTPLAVVLMEAFWGYPWLLWAGKWETLHLGGTPLSFLSILALVAISFLLTRFLLSRAWSTKATRWTVLGLGLLVMFAVVRFEYGGGIALSSNKWFAYAASLFANMLNGPCAIIVALPASAYFWWRGMILARAREYNYVHSNVMFGAGSYVVLALIWAASLGVGSIRSMAGAIAPHAAAFFFCGLVAMALSNLHSVQKRMRPDEPRTVSLGRWLPIVLSVVTVIVIIGVLIATASSLDIVGAIKHLFGATSGFFGMVFHYIGIGFQYIMVPFEWLASLLFMFIAYIMRLVGNRTTPQTQSEPGGPPQLPPTTNSTSSAALLTALKWSFFAVAVVAVTILILRSINKNPRHNREGKPDFEETRESFWSWNRLFNDIILFLERIFARFMPWRKGKVASGSGGPSVTLAEQPMTTLKIREVFRHLLRDAGKAGIVWRHSETPFEYARRFAETIPEVAPHLKELTGIYVNVRYSTVEPGTGEAARANILWRQIKERLRQAQHG